MYSIQHLFCIDVDDQGGCLVLCSVDGMCCLNFGVLGHLCIPGINLTWSQCTTASTLFKTSLLICIRDIDLWFSFLVESVRLWFQGGATLKG